MRRKRLDHGARLHLVLVLFWLVFSIGSSLYRFTLPTDGWLASEPEDFDSYGFIYHENVMGAASGLQTGDQVIAIDGVSAQNGLTASWAARKSWQTGNTVQYTVLRGDQELQIQVSLVKWSLWPYVKTKFTAANLVSWLGLAIFLTMGFLAFWRRPEVLAARALWVLSVAWFIPLMYDQLPRMIPDIVDPLASLFHNILVTATFTILLPPALIRFALFFPKPKPSVLRHPWIAYIPYAVGMTGILAFIYEFFIFGFAWTGLSVLVTIVLLIHNAASMRDAVSQAQLRWGLGGVIAGLGLLLPTWIDIFFGLPGPVITFLNVISPLSLGVMGVALGIAILRYRLFDIDVIIRRTLQYTLLSGLLALVYFGGVVVLEGLLSPLTGKADSPLVSVVTTLAVAALFNPLRKGVQEFIDRRFYRKKYDAEKALAEFAAAARAETDLAQLSERLTGTVQEALQPEKVGLWLRQSLTRDNPHH